MRPTRGSFLTLRSAPSPPGKELFSMTVSASWAAAGFARSTKRQARKAPAQYISLLRNRLNKQLFFVLQRLFGPPSSAAARTKQIDANFDPLHQGRHFLHRAPNVMGELRPGVFHCFQGSGNNAIGAHQLATQAVRSLGENAVDLLGLSARQV